MPDDDPFADDEPVGPPLPPDDRLWRHPSELSWARLDDPPRPAAAPRLWTVALGAGVTGAVLAVSVVAFTGGLGGRVTERIVEAVPTSAVLPSLADRTPGPPPPLDAAASVVGLLVTRPDGESAGSGVVYRDDGAVLTNAHVVDGAGAVSVVLDDGTVFPARVVGTDRLTDVAVVAVDGDGDVDWQPAVLGSAARLSVEDPVVAVGASTSTAGAVRGVGQRARKAGLVLHGLVVTDAPATDDDSGGALCDGDGVVVGLTTVVDGVAFAIPADVARAIAEDLLDGGVRHAWLGIHGGDAEGGGVHVAAVDGPAAAAGVVAGDVIVAFDGTPVATMSDLVLALRDRAPGEIVQVEVRRAGDVVTVAVTLAERP